MSAQLTTIRLYGDMGARFGRVHRMDVGSAAEAVRALCSQLPGFERYMVGSKDRGVGYAVFYDDDNLDKNRLRNASHGRDIRIAPMILGSKRAGVFQIIVGVIMIAAAIIAAPATGGGSLVAVFAQGGFWGAVAMMGASMVLGGVAQMLTPMPKGLSSKDDSGNTPNPHFNGPVNTIAQGNYAPVLHGELIVGSAVVSAGITIKDTSIVPVLGGKGDGGGDAVGLYPLQETP